jgi:hypothetical protein
MFYVMEKQRQTRLQFVQKELEQESDWSRMVVTDESYLILGEDHRRLWRRPGETGR